MFRERLRYADLRGAFHEARAPEVADQGQIALRPNRVKGVRVELADMAYPSVQNSAGRGALNYGYQLWRPRQNDVLIDRRRSVIQQRRQALGEATISHRTSRRSRVRHRSTEGAEPRKGARRVLPRPSVKPLQDSDAQDSDAPPVSDRWR